MTTVEATTDVAVDFFFADDSRQAYPARPGMGPIVGFGGIRVAANHLASLNKSLEQICRNKFGFPPGEEFKWSPGRQSWMATNVTGGRTRDLFEEVVAQLAAHDVVTTVITSEERGLVRSCEENARRRTVKYYLERIEQQCARRRTRAFVVVDQPGGGSKQQATFLARCAETVENGTYWVEFAHMSHSLLAADSRSSRVLQAADLVTSVVTAMVAGRTKYAQPIFDLLLPLFDRNGERIYGYGLKIDQDYEFCNLYHWLLGVDTWWSGNLGTPLPHPKCRYAKDPMKE